MGKDRKRVRSSVAGSKNEEQNRARGGKENKIITYCTFLQTKKLLPWYLLMWRGSSLKSYTPHAPRAFFTFPPLINKYTHSTKASDSFYSWAGTYSFLEDFSCSSQSSRITMVHFQTVSVLFQDVEKKMFKTFASYKGFVTHVQVKLAKFCFSMSVKLVFFLNA